MVRPEPWAAVTTNQLGAAGLPCANALGRRGMVMDGRLAAGPWRAFTCCCLAGAMVALASLGAGKKG